MNAPLGQKYLLTADHCFVDKADISNFQYWLLIFNYELPCRSRSKPGPIRQVVQVAFELWEVSSYCLRVTTPGTVPGASRQRRMLRS